MKTLIFNGSPRKNGDTVVFINEFIKYLDGEYKIIDAYYCNIHPCIDCRYCKKNHGCSQEDEMNAQSVGIACSHNTENISPINDKVAVENIKKIAIQFNSIT